MKFPSLQTVTFVCLLVNLACIVVNVITTTINVKLIKTNRELQRKNLERQAFLEKARTWQGRFYDAFDALQAEKPPGQRINDM